MHIGVLQAYFARESVGGGEVHTEHLARALEDSGHKVTVFTDEPADPGREVTDIDVRTYPTPAKVNPVNEFVLAHRAREDLAACDVVLLTDESGFLGVDCPVPTAMVFHLVWHGWISRNRPIWNVLAEKPQALLYAAMERRIVSKTDAIVAISPNMAEDISRIGDIEEKLCQIPNGVDVDRFRLRETNDEFTVHFQGRLVSMKNPDLLVEAAARSWGDWQLTIGGDGPLREELKQRVGEAGLDDRVELLGYVPESELAELYARTHVYVLPSTYEGMPLTVLEAAASGSAIVASPRAATDFVTQDIGMVVDPDAAMLAKTLDGLAADPERVAKMGMAARKRAEEYAWAAVAEQYEALFESLVN